MSDNQMQLDRYQAKILETIFNNVEISGDISTLEFSLSGGFLGKYRAGYFRSGVDGEYVVFNIPTNSHSVFFGLTESNPHKTALMLANLEDYERENRLALRLGDAIVTPGHNNATDYPFAVILLRTETLRDCAGLPDSFTIDGVRTSFFFVVPLTEEEYKFRDKCGHDALMDSFEESGKSILF